MAPSAPFDPTTCRETDSSDPDLGVLVRRTGSSAAWESPEMTSYTDEDHLQRILADAPDRVPACRPQR